MLGKQIFTAQGGLVLTAGAVLSIYTGHVVYHLNLDFRLYAVCVSLFVACPLLWIWSLKLAPNEASGVQAKYLRNKSFPFVAFFVLFTFLPEFWFGSPSLTRAILVLALTFTMWCLLATVGNLKEAPPVFFWIESRSSWIAGVIVTAHLVIFAILIVLRHYHFGSVLGEDTGYYNQIFWSTLQGEFFKGTLTQQRYNDPPVSSEFDLHNSPILLLLLPVYWLYPSFYTLLVLKSVAVSLSAAPLFLLAKDKIGGIAANLVVVSYLFSKNIVNQSINGFHSIEFVAVFLLFTFYFFWRHRFVPFLVFMVLSLFVREEAALTAFVFGVYSLCLKRTWRWVVTPSLLSVVWWYCSTELILVRSRIAMEGLETFFLAFGTSHNEILVNVIAAPDQFIRMIVTKDTLEYLFEILKPTAFVPLISIVSMFALPIMGINVLIGAFWPSIISITQHYSLIITVCVFAALVAGFAGMGRYSDFFSLRRNVFFAGVACLLIPPAVVGVKDIIQFGSGGQSVVQDFLPKPYGPTLRSILDRIEPTAAVAAPAILLPQMSYRPMLYHSQALWRYHDPQFKYIVLVTDPKLIRATGGDREKYDSLVTAVNRSVEYRLSYKKDGFEVYRKIDRDYIKTASIRSSPQSDGKEPKPRIETPHDIDGRSALSDTIR